MQPIIRPALESDWDQMRAIFYSVIKGENIYSFSADTPEKDAGLYFPDIKTPSQFDRIIQRQREILNGIILTINKELPGAIDNSGNIIVNTLLEFVRANINIDIEVARTVEANTKKE